MREWLHIGWFLLCLQRTYWRWDAAPQWNGAATCAWRLDPQAMSLWRSTVCVSLLRSFRPDALLIRWARHDLNRGHWIRTELPLLYRRILCCMRCTARSLLQTIMSSSTRFSRPGTRLPGGTRLGRLLWRPDGALLRWYARNWHTILSPCIPLCVDSMPVDTQSPSS